MLTRSLTVFFVSIIFLGLTCVIDGVIPVYAKHAGEEHSEEHLEKESLTSIPDPPRNPFSRMVEIPAGNFKRGSTFKENKFHLDMCRKWDRTCQLWWFKDEFPAKLVFLQSFWIDMFETTNQEYLEFVEATGHRPALDDTCETEKCRQGNLWTDTGFPQSIRNQPVTQVSWFDADVYCRWREKRLPSEAEWEKAARGPSGSMYPWGKASPKSRAAYMRKWQGVFTMTRVGSYSNGASLYGVFDLAGNVWEWVDDWYHLVYYSLGKKKNPKGPAKGEFKILRGGSWVNYPDTLRSALRRWSRPEVRFNDTGFRCAKDDVDEAQKK